MVRVNAFASGSEGGPGALKQLREELQAPRSVGFRSCVQTENDTAATSRAPFCTGGQHAASFQDCRTRGKVFIVTVDL